MQARNTSNIVYKKTKKKQLNTSQDFNENAFN